MSAQTYLENITDLILAPIDDKKSEEARQLAQEFADQYRSGAAIMLPSVMDVSWDNPPREFTPVTIRNPPDDYDDTVDKPIIVEK